MIDKVVEEDNLQNMRGNNFKGFNFLEQIDLFGIPIDLIYKQKNKHKTQLGGLISLGIAILVILQVYNVLNEVIFKLQPQVIFQDTVVESPSRNELNQENFTFVLGMLDSSSLPFIDESIYTISGEFRVRERQVTEENKNIDPSLRPVATSIIKLNISKCRQEDFQSPLTSKYFLSLNYTNLYCLKIPEQSSNKSLFLQGQYDNDIFSLIRITINKCNITSLSAKCKDNAIIENKLSRSTLQVYYTNQVIEVTNFDQPFRPMGQTQFWNTNTDFMQRIVLMYKTVFVTDDTGILFSEMEKKQSLQYSSDRALMNKKTLQTDLFDISIYLEKNKEINYIRFYLKIDKAASLVGGMFNILILLGSLISIPYSKMQLTTKLINSTFNFELSNKQSSTQPNKDIEKGNLLQSKIQQSQNFLQDTQIKNTEEQSKKGQLKYRQERSLQKLTTTQFTTDAIEQQRQRVDSIKYNVKNSQYPVNDSVIDKNKQNQEKNSSEKQRIKMTVLDYIKSFFSSYLSLFRSEKTLMIQYSQEKLVQFTDIRYIINKLVELDKLKMLILDPHQLSLFNYIEKPLVDTKCISENIREKSQSLSIEQENVNALYRKNRNENSMQAEEALKRVIGRQVNNDTNNNNVIDKKLVKLVDTSLVFKLMNQSNTNLNQLRQSSLNKDLSFSKKYDFSLAMDPLTTTTQNQSPEIQDSESLAKINFPDMDIEDSYTKKIYDFIPTQNPLIYFNKIHNFKSDSSDLFESTTTFQLKKSQQSFKQSQQLNQQKQLYKCKGSEEFEDIESCTNMNKNENVIENQSPIQ